MTIVSTRSFWISDTLFFGYSIKFGVGNLFTLDKECELGENNPNVLRSIFTGLDVKNTYGLFL